MTEDDRLSRFNNLEQGLRELLESLEFSREEDTGSDPESLIDDYRANHGFRSRNYMIRYTGRAILTDKDANSTTSE